MTVKPIHESDYYGTGFEQTRLARLMKGPRVMSFGAVRTDDDRLAKAKADQRWKDHCPNVPEWQAWSMRPRNKSKEIGPSMKFNSHFQAERLMDTIQANTQTFFTTKEVTSGRGQSTGAIDSKIKRYIKTGHYETPDTEGLGREDSVDANLMGVAGYEKLRKQQEKVKADTMQRSSKLQRANYLVQPKNILSGIHQKTYFKAATSVSRADACCLRVRDNELSD